MFNLNNLFNKKYKSIFTSKGNFDVDQNELNQIKELIDSKIDDKKLDGHKTFIIDVYYAIYKESNLSFEEFKNRLNENIDIIKTGECPPDVDGYYQDAEKKLVINEDSFEKGPIYDPWGRSIMIDEKNATLYREYTAVRTIIHESLHAISNNDFFNKENHSKHLSILDELKTVQLEALIYDKYFSDIFKKEKAFADTKNSNLEYYNRETSNSNNYNIPNNLKFRGYKIVNTMADYIHLIDPKFNEYYWNNESVKGTNLDNEVFYNLNQIANRFNESVCKAEVRIEIDDFYEFQKAFYTCIDYQIKIGALDKESFLDLKEEILNNQFNFPRKEFTGTNQWNDDYEHSLKFDIYYLDKIEKENINLLGINETYPKEDLDRIQEQFDAKKFDTSIDSSSYIEEKKEIEI